MSLHPVMQAAIAPFLKAPDMRHLRRVPPLQTFRHQLAGVWLDCEIEYEAAERQTRDEPGCPADAIVYSVKTEHGDDVTEILSNEQRDEISSDFLNQKEEY